MDERVYLLMIETCIIVLAEVSVKELLVTPMKK